MKTLIRLEEAGLLLLACFLYYEAGFAWWLFPIFLFVPDLSMLGYVISNRAGALVYNIVHHRSISILLFIFGTITGFEMLVFGGLIIFAHTTLDRIFHFGLKYPDEFKHTHLS